MESDWFNRYCEEDPSWQKSLLELVGTDCETRDALFSHYGYSISQFLDHINSLREKCQSPIELKFLQALLVAAPEHGLPVEHEPYHINSASQGKVESWGLVILPQHEMALSKAYRADFLLLTVDRHGGHPRRLVIECDGHDFHERTKEQAARDKSRDRDMTAAGFAIMRFTGSEIHKDAKECAYQACTYLSRRRV